MTERTTATDDAELYGDTDRHRFLGTIVSAGSPLVLDDGRTTMAVTGVDGSWSLGKKALAVGQLHADPSGVSASMAAECFELVEDVDPRTMPQTAHLRGDVREGASLTQDRECPACGDRRIHLLVQQAPAVVRSGAWGKYLNPVYQCQGCQLAHTLRVYEADPDDDEAELDPYGRDAAEAGGSA